MFPVQLTALYSRGFGSSGPGTPVCAAGPRPWWSLPSRACPAAPIIGCFTCGAGCECVFAQPPPARTVEAEGQARGPLRSRATGLAAAFLLPRVDFGGEQEPKNCKTDTQPPGCACAPAGEGSARPPPRADLPQAGCEGTWTGWLICCCPGPLPPSSRPRPQLASMRGTESNSLQVTAPDRFPPLQICEPSWEVDCAAASPANPFRWQRYVRLYLVCQEAGSGFVHNARKAKSEKGKEVLEMKITFSALPTACSGLLVLSTDLIVYLGFFRSG